MTEETPAPAPVAAVDGTTVTPVAEVHATLAEAEVDPNAKTVAIDDASAEALFRQILALDSALIEHGSSITDLLRGVARAQLGVLV